MSNIRIENVSRQFSSVTVLDQVSLEVQEGELFSLLGPSGCGKTTLLNIIAGFLAPTRGSVWLGDRNITQLPPYRRDIGMVFQNYALFPHLNVFQNVAYGLTLRKLSHGEVKRRVDEVLSIVQLEQYADRMPHQLSGGQQQRVAIARALAIRPAVLLMDEPLSNLDAKLRKSMQSELRSLQRRVGITTILVTHDQEEALALSDRIGVMGHGRLQQVGTPVEIYRRPFNRFVAEFIGEANFITATLDSHQTRENGYLTFTVPSEGHRDPLHLAVQPGSYSFGKKSIVTFMLRPEHIQVGKATDQRGYNQTNAEVVDCSYAGSLLRLRVRLQGGGEFLVTTSDIDLFSEGIAPNQQLHLSWEPSALVPISEGE
ncbi:ABC transporter ATP-binding protein [Alicyclobacillus kakegawensis]|uniref:ABC transporter ATP-binding protein n=1 Tax=Alicyclobacillus kakegawensis TaxID=392012 RepID=UPI000833B672|nr:ABC transporter ATP-binding protein [Alicyclobacillus kakegawensis]